MDLFKSKKGIFGLERVGYTKKHILFALLTLLGGLYLFLFTNAIVSPLVDYSLESIPFFGVRNIIGLSFFVLAITIYLNQIDYKNIEILGWNLTYWLFLITIILSGLWLFKPSTESVNFLVNYGIPLFPFLNIKNVLGVSLLLFSYKIYKVVKP